MKPLGRKDKMGDVSRKKQMSAVEHSPAPKAALALLKHEPVSASDDPSIPQTRSITLSQHLDELTPSFEVASRRRFKTV